MPGHRHPQRVLVHQALHRHSVLERQQCRRGLQVLQGCTADKEQSRALPHLNRDHTLLVEAQVSNFHPQVISFPSFSKALEI